MAAREEWRSRWEPGDFVLASHYAGYAPAVLREKVRSFGGLWIMQKWDAKQDRWTAHSYVNEYRFPFRPFPRPELLPPPPPYRHPVQPGHKQFWRLQVVLLLQALVISRLTESLADHARAETGTASPERDAAT